MSKILETYDLLKANWIFQLMFVPIVQTLTVLVIISVVVRMFRLTAKADRRLLILSLIIIILLAGSYILIGGYEAIKEFMI